MPILDVRVKLKLRDKYWADFLLDRLETVEIVRFLCKLAGKIVTTAKLRAVDDKTDLAQHLEEN